jgi:hypothetical protein
VDVTSTGLGPLTAVEVEIHKLAGAAGSYALCSPISILANTTDGTNTTVTCPVSYTLVSGDLNGTSITLEASANATLSTADDTYSGPTNTSVNLGTVTVTGTTTVTQAAPATLGSVVPVTIAITNWGPIAIGGVSITPPAGVNLTGTACAAPVNTTAATNAAPTPVTCAATYTVTSNDVLADITTLDFDVVVADAANLEVPVTTPASITVHLSNLTTSLMAPSCVLVKPTSVGEFCLHQVCKNPCESWHGSKTACTTAGLTKLALV